MFYQLRRIAEVHFSCVQIHQKLVKHFIRNVIHYDINVHFARSILLGGSFLCASERAFSGLGAYVQQGVAKEFAAGTKDIPVRVQLLLACILKDKCDI